MFVIVSKTMDHGWAAFLFQPSEDEEEDDVLWQVLLSSAVMWTSSLPQHPQSGSQLRSRVAPYSPVAFLCTPWRAVRTL